MTPQRRFKHFKGLRDEEQTAKDHCNVIGSNTALNQIGNVSADKGDFGVGVQNISQHSKIALLSLRKMLILVVVNYTQNLCF